MNTIAERIWLAMKTAGLSVADVIRAGGPSRPTMYRIATDPGYKPEVYTIERLATILRVSGEWIQTGEGPMEARDQVAEEVASYQADPPLDLAVLGLAIETLEIFLAHNHSKLDPKAKARAIVSLYTAMRLWRPEALTAANVTPLIKSLLAG